MRLRVGVLQLAFQVRQHALKRCGPISYPAVAVLVSHRHVMLGAMKNGLLLRRCEFTKWRIGIKIHGHGKPGEQLFKVRHIKARGPWLNGTQQRRIPVRDYQIKVHFQGGAQAITRRTRTIRRVEGKRTRF